MSPVIQDWFSYTDGSQGVAPTDAPLRSTLKRCHEQALDEAKGNHIEARRMLASHIACNRRFDHLDPEKLAAGFEAELNSGVRLDLAAPELRPGGKPREQQLVTHSVPAAVPHTEEYRIKRRR